MFDLGKQYSGGKLEDGSLKLGMGDTNILMKKLSKGHFDPRNKEHAVHSQDTSCRNVYKHE